MMLGARIAAALALALPMAGAVAPAASAQVLFSEPDACRDCPMVAQAHVGSCVMVRPADLRTRTFC
jgi:hypothetical protein